MPRCVDVGIVRHIEPPRDLACRKPVRLMPHEQPEDLQPGWLGKSGKRCNEA